MHREKNCVLGIDTSNYKTSAAVADENGEILCDLRRLLRVKQGERGLRQSDALFQHVENLPQLLTEALSENRAERIGAVAVSEKPRPAQGSYMPVFKAGIGFGQAVAAALQVPCYMFSHQEGHLEAIRRGTEIQNKERFLCYHLSGGTCELLDVTEKRDGYEIQIIGGSKDLSFGQTIDRVGVKLGMSFPAGEEMDRRAISAQTAGKYLKKIPSDGLFFNLSGIETQCSRQAERLMNENSGAQQINQLIRELFDKIVKILAEITQKAAAETGVTDVMFTGGVSSSAYISRKLTQYFRGTAVSVEFGEQSLSQDNAVGTALLGGKRLWL